MKKMIFCCLCLLIGYTALQAQNKINPDRPSLPARETYVPDDILAKLISRYGDNLYSITCIKGDDLKNEYWIRTRNGMSLSETRLSETEVYAMK